MDADAFRRAAPRHAGSLAAAGPVRAGLLRRRRSGVPAADPRRSPSTPGTASSRATCSSSTEAARPQRSPQFTIIDAPSFKADPARTARTPRSSIALNFAKRLVLIGGTSYAGEIKKSIFSIAELPAAAATACCSMHCSANVGARGDVALFFGLSGTGKTTLSSDPDRGLIGDDEHGWSDRRRLQLRGRLLRQDDPAVGRSRAADLRDDAPVRHRARERRVRYQGTRAIRNR